MYTTAQLNTINEILRTTVDEYATGYPRTYPVAHIVAGGVLVKFCVKLSDGSVLKEAAYKGKRGRSSKGIVPALHSFLNIPDKGVADSGGALVGEVYRAINRSSLSNTEFFNVAQISLARKGF